MGGGREECRGTHLEIRSIERETQFIRRGLEGRGSTTKHIHLAKLFRLPWNTKRLERSWVHKLGHSVVKKRSDFFSREP
jgi:hypothetical protein